MVQDDLQSGAMTLELSDELIARVDALAYRLKHSDLGRHLRLTRELVLRLALMHGIEELERMGPPGD